MGRDKYSHRRVIEFTVGIRIQDLKNFGILNKGSVNASWTSTITRGNDTLAVVNYEVSIKDATDKNEIKFDYYYQGEHIVFSHPIVIQPVHLGGYRYFFRCNCTKNGEYCGRRVKALYFAGNIFACRHCLELVYVNCRYSRDDRHRFMYLAEHTEKKADILRKYKHPRKANIIDRKANYFSMRHDMELHNQLIKLSGMTDKLLKRIKK